MTSKRAVFLAQPIEWNLSSVKSTFEATSATGSLDSTQFQLFLRKIGFPKALFTSKLLIQRLFYAVDSSGDNSISWNDTKKMLQTLTSNSEELLLKFTFRMYDLDSLGQISFGDLSKILPDVCRTLGRACGGVLASPFDCGEHIDHFIEKLFKRLTSRSAKLDFKEFRQLSAANATMLSILTLGGVGDPVVTLTSPVSSPPPQRSGEETDILPTTSGRGRGGRGRGRGSGRGRGRGRGIATTSGEKAIKASSRPDGSWTLADELEKEEEREREWEREQEKERMAKQRTKCHLSDSLEEISDEDDLNWMMNVKGKSNTKKEASFESEEEEDGEEEESEKMQLLAHNHRLVEQVLGLQKALKAKMEEGSHNGDQEGEEKIKHLQTELKESMAREVQLEERIQELEEERSKRREIMKRMKARIKQEIKRNKELSKQQATPGEIKGIRLQCENQLRDYHFVLAFMLASNETMERLKDNKIDFAGASGDFPPPPPCGLKRTALIQKKGGLGTQGKFVKWQRRICLLMGDGSILYWAPEDAPKPRGALDAKTVTGIKNASSLESPPNTLEIQTSSGRVWALSFDSQQEMEDWRDQIMQLIRPLPDED